MMAKQIKVKLEKSTEVTESLPSVETPADLPITSSQQPKQSTQFVFLGLLLAALLVTAFAVRKSTQQKYKAAVAPVIKRVAIDPGIIIAEPDSKPIYMSALAYDTNGQPVYSNVFYSWSISTSGSVGTLILNPGNDKIATFIPLNKGTGDIVVTATNNKGKVLNSIPVFVGIEPGSLINGSFETGTDIPEKWYRTNQSNEHDIRTNALAYDDTYSFKFKGDIKSSKGLRQTIPFTWGSGTKLFIGGWLKTLKLTNKGTSQITIVARYSDDTREKFTLAFPTGKSFDWTYRLGSITLTKTTVSLIVKLEYNNQNGEGYYDAITLSSKQPLKSKATQLQAQKISIGEVEE